MSSFPYSWVIAWSQNISLFDLENDNISNSSHLYRTPRLL